MKGTVTKKKAQTAKATEKISRAIPIPEDKLAAMMELGNKWFWKELDKLDALFSATQDIEVTDLKTYTFACNAKRYGFEALKRIAQATAGNVQQRGAGNTSEHKNLQAQLIEAARERLAQSGFAKPEDAEHTDETTGGGSDE